MNMFSQKLEQRHLYNLRLKSQMDGPARLEGAFNEGFNRGYAEGLKTGFEMGKLIAKINILQELLAVTVPTLSELYNYSDVQLLELAGNLEQTLRRGDQLSD